MWVYNIHIQDMEYFLAISIKILPILHKHRAYRVYIQPTFLEICCMLRLKGNLFKSCRVAGKNQSNHSSSIYPVISIYSGHFLIGAPTFKKQNLYLKNSPFKISYYSRTNSEFGHIVFSCCSVFLR